MHELRIEHDGVTLAASYSPAGEKALVAVHAAGEGTRQGLQPDGTLTPEYERTLVDWLGRL